MDLAENTHLSVGMVHVWRFPLIAARQEIKALIHWLDPLEQNELARLTRPAERDKRIVAKGRLRYILSRYVGGMPDAVDIKREPTGRPCLAASSPVDLQFSLSHSGNLGLVGIAAHAIGVDIEKLRQTKRVDELAARFFSAREAESLAQHPADEQTAWFFRQWVLKEAYLKSIGGRVPADLSNCEIEWGASGPSIIRSEEVSQQAARALIEIPLSPGYVAALAVSPAARDVKVFDL